VQFIASQGWTPDRGRAPIEARSVRASDSEIWMELDLVLSLSVASAGLSRAECSCWLSALLRRQATCWQSGPEAGRPELP
jgi:hypothetical protein